jgi:ATP-dependent helicase YprA (DUF1998 family)
MPLELGIDIGGLDAVFMNTYPELSLPLDSKLEEAGRKNNNRTCYLDCWS